MRQEISGYQIVRQIGMGGMSRVFEAIGPDGVPVALKLLHPAIAADPQARERLRREVSVLQRVRGPYVASILDFETEGDDVFIVTELIEGRTLDQDVRIAGRYEGADLIELGEELSRALAAIHDAGVLHRDLKPSNVMTGPRGIVLIDFGIAQLGNDLRITQAGSLAHTPGYVDPRVVRGEDPDTDADFWALAAVLAYAATGEHPYGSGSNVAVMQRVLAGEPTLDGLEPEAAQAFERALNVDLSGRLGFDELVDCLAGRGEPADAEAADMAADGVPTMVAPVAERMLEPMPATIVDVPEPPTVVEPAPTMVEPAPRYPVPYEPPAPIDQSPVLTAQPLPPSTPDPSLLPTWLAAPPRATLTVTLFGAAIAILAGYSPAVAVVVLLLAMWVFDMVGSAREELGRRRMRRGGPYSGDRIYSFVRLPWAGLWSLIKVAFGMALAVFVGFGGAWVASFVFVTPPTVLTIIAMAATAIIAWLFPWGRLARLGARVTHAALAPSTGYRIFWVAIGIVVVLGALVAVSASGGTNWETLTNSPFA